MTKFGVEMKTKRTLNSTKRNLVLDALLLAAFLIATRRG